MTVFSFDYLSIWVLIGETGYIHDMNLRFPPQDTHPS